MKKTLLILAGIALLTACGSSSKNDDKQAKLAELKKQRDELNAQIVKIEKEFTASNKTGNDKVKTVTVESISPIAFSSYIDLQGRVDGDENVSLSPEMGGLVTKVNVKVGDVVQKGQLLAEVDSRVLQQSVAELQGSLDLANTMYEKQKNLWEQKIGTEIQYLTAKNQKESLDRKLATLQQQLDMSRLKAPFEGTIDGVDIRLGQMASPGVPAIRIVNTSTLKVKGEVPETYASKVRPGNPVLLYFPDIKDSLKSQISFVARSINALNRTFSVEANLPSKKNFQPNMVAILKIADYTNSKAFVVPVNIIQKAENGDFVFINENNIAKKVPVTVGKIYNSKAEIVKGLKAGDKIITDGFQELNDGETINTL